MNITTSCTGCGLCSQLCPKKAITMKPDLEGFLAPYVDDSLCIKCNICAKSCPQNTSINKSVTEQYYSAVNKNIEDLAISSSGGVFLALAKEILKKNGYVVGCIFDKHWKAVHVCTNELDTVYKMCGSKYVQSEIYSILPDVKEILDRGDYLLFTGTACQNAAVRRYLNKEYDKLILVDILCHGVPSPLLFSKYIEYLHRKYKGELVAINFRSKKQRGWTAEHGTCITVKRSDGTVHDFFPFVPAYFSSFFYGDDLRESCYQCHYAGEHRVSDLTIGDYWGSFRKYHRHCKEGISILSVNTDKGQSILDDIAGQFITFDALTEAEGKGSNTNFFHPTARKKVRSGYYDGFENLKYEQICKKSFTAPENSKAVLRSLYGKIVPEKIRMGIHKLHR